MYQKYIELSKKIFKLLTTGQLVCRQLFTKNDFDDMLNLEPDIIYYSGHGTEDGDWVLDDGSLIKKDDFHSSKPLTVFSTCCFSHKWSTNGFIQLIGSTHNEFPYSDGNNFLGHRMRNLPYSRCRELCKVFNVSVGENDSDQYVHQKFFEYMEDYFTKKLLQFKLSLKQKPSEYLPDLINLSLKDLLAVGWVTLPYEDVGGIKKFYPRGFKSLQDFKEFMTNLRNVLPPDSTIYFQGSSISGYRHRKKESPYFDHKSDYDVAIASPTLYSLVPEQNRKNGNHSEPLKKDSQWGTEEPLNRLKNFSTNFSNYPASRELNFLIYSDYSSALNHSGLTLAPRGNTITGHEYCPAMRSTLDPRIYY